MLASSTVHKNEADPINETTANGLSPSTRLLARMQENCKKMCTQFLARTCSKMHNMRQCMHVKTRKICAYLWSELRAAIFARKEERRAIRARDEGICAVYVFRAIDMLIYV